MLSSHTSLVQSSTWSKVLQEIEYKDIKYMRAQRKRVEDSIKEHVSLSHCNYLILKKLPAHIEMNKTFQKNEHLASEGTS